MRFATGVDWESFTVDARPAAKVVALDTLLLLTTEGTDTPLLIHEVIDIDAMPGEVWDVLTDLDHYGSWNPFVVQCASSLIPGEPIDMWVRLGAREPQAQREWMTTYTEGREFSYAIKPIPFGALRSIRSHSLAALSDGRTRYTSRFELRGWLGPLAAVMQGRGMRQGFPAMSAALKKRVEARSKP